MQQLDFIFKSLYFSICGIAKWIFLIRMASETIKGGNNGDIEGIIKAIVNCAFSYASLYVIVDVLDSVQKSFN